MLGFGLNVTDPSPLFVALPNAVVQIAFGKISGWLIVEGETKLLAPAFNLMFATLTPVGGVVCTCGHGLVGVVADVQGTPPTEPAGTENPTPVGLLSGIGSTGAALGSLFGPGEGGPKFGVVFVGSPVTSATPTS